MTETLRVMLKAPTRQTLGHGVADSIRQAIWDGIFPGGQRLPEAKIAQTLKVSRAPVRDALASLEQEGIVHRTASGASIVARLVKADVEEICSLRLPLELLAAQRVALHGTETDWTRLGGIIRATEHVNTPEDLAQVDLEFHEALVRAARHGRLLASWLSLSSQIRLVMVQRNLTDHDSLRGTVQGHTEFLAALQARDATSAIGQLQHHLQGQCEWVLGSF